jgi:outer membrane protein assembly factor BamB
VANGVVYIGSQDDNVYALNAATVAKLWNYSIGGVIGDASPAVANGVVYIGSLDGTVYSFGLAGTSIASRPTSGRLRPSHTLRPQNGNRS